MVTAPSGPKQITYETRIVAPPQCKRIPSADPLGTTRNTLLDQSDFLRLELAKKVCARRQARHTRAHKYMTSVAIRCTEFTVSQSLSPCAGNMLNSADHVFDVTTMYV